MHQREDEERLHGPGQPICQHRKELRKQASGLHLEEQVRIELLHRIDEGAI